MEQDKRPARRRRSTTATDNPLTSLKITKSADRQLTAQAKKLDIGKGEYASAAIAFFAESGLDPTAERPQGLASLGEKVGAAAANVRAHNADIGNRLYALVRGVERMLTGFMQQQQLTTFAYLESIESNLLRHLVAMDTHTLQPMMEHLFRTELEAYIGRGVSLHTLMEFTKDPDGWQKQTATYDTQRDQQLVKRMREFVGQHAMPIPKPVMKPGPTPLPKPVVPTAAPTPGPPTAPLTPATAQPAAPATPAVKLPAPVPAVANPLPPDLPRF